MVVRNYQPAYHRGDFACEDQLDLSVGGGAWGFPVTSAVTVSGDRKHWGLNRP